MKITFLGTSHGYPEPNKFCSSTMLTVGEKNYFIDAGAPISPLMLNYGATWASVGGIFITHNHSDHTLGLIDLMERSLWRQCKGRYNWDIYFPTENPLRQYLNESFFAKVEDAGCIRFHYYGDGFVFEDENIKVASIPTLHCPYSHSFIIEAEGKRILFSGDLKVGMEDYPEVLFEKDFDLLVLEGTHTALNDESVLDKVNRSRVKKVLINHNSWDLNTPEVRADFLMKAAGKCPEFAVDGAYYLL